MRTPSLDSKPTAMDDCKDTVHKCAYCGQEVGKKKAFADWRRRSRRLSSIDASE